MKKHLLAIALLCLTLSTDAQDQQQEIESKPVANTGEKWQGWTINPYVFLGTAASNIDFVGESNNPGGSAVFGCLIGYNLNSHVSFNTGVAFSAYIWQKELLSNALYVDYLQSSNSFLQIPILAKITTSKYRKVGFLVETGFSLNFLTSMEDRVVYELGSDDVSSDDSYNNKFCPTFNLMLGLRIPVSKSTWIDAGFDTYAFLVDQYSDISGKMSGTGIKIGVQTKLTK